MNPPLPHAVSRLRTARLARSSKPFLARGGSQAPRCAGCRLVLSHCLCAQRPVVPNRAGVCLIMADIEPLKPSNTGWLIADVVTDTFAFGWARTEVDLALPALLADPQWQPYVVFPGEFVPGGRVVSEVQVTTTKRPLFILLGAWAAEGVEAKIGPSEDSFRRFRRRISRYLGRKRRKIDRCGQFAADVPSAAQAPRRHVARGAQDVSQKPLPRPPASAQFAK